MSKVREIIYFVYFCKLKKKKLQVKGSVRYLWITGWLMCTVSCSTTKYVGDHEYLLDRVIIRVDSSRIKAGDLKPYLRQRPNYKIFGLLKWPLYVYNWSGRNEKNWLNRELRRLGEPPVIADSSLTEQSRVEFTRYLINRGYLHAGVAVETDTTAGKKATVTYRVAPNAPYRIRNYRMSLYNPMIDSIARLEAPRLSWPASVFHAADDLAPLVREGDLFDRNLLDRERQRITRLLRRRGYYAFRSDDFRFLVDSFPGRREVDLEMTLSPFPDIRTGGETEERAYHRPYYIRKVRVMTGYDPLDPASGALAYASDSVQTQRLTVYYGKTGQRLRPGVLQQRCFIVPGALYNERNFEQTYNSYMALQALRYVNIRYDGTEENDTLKLDCTILTAPEKTQGVGVEVEGTNSHGDLGFASELNYQHRNLFRGSELFSAKIRGAYEAISGTKGSGIGNFREYAGEMSILFPSFVPEMAS